MNIRSNGGSNMLNWSRTERVSYKVQRTINASLNAATSTRAVSFFFYCYADHRNLHSFPTRRSSDLKMPDATTNPSLSLKERQLWGTDGQFDKAFVEGHPGLSTITYTTHLIKDIDGASTANSGRDFQIGRAHV